MRRNCIEVQRALHRFLCALHRFLCALHRLRCFRSRFLLFHRHFASQSDSPSNLIRDRLFLLSSAVAELAVRVNMIHLSRADLRLLPASLFPLPLLLSIQSLLEEFSRGLEHSEASFTSTIQPFSLTHPVDFGGKLSVDEGNRRSVTLLARTNSGF